MNLMVLLENDFVAGDKVRISDERRLNHMHDILKISEGQMLSVGKLNGLMGQGKVSHIGEGFVEIDVELNQAPPAALPLTLIMPLPRPPVLRRSLATAASLGIKKIIILNFAKVEKSLWNSSSLHPDIIQEQLILGLEQAKDTFLPQVILKDRFKPFVEDELPALVKNKTALVAHPGCGQLCPRDVKGEVLLVIGPEGGLVDFEVAKLASLGVSGVDLGSRILRVETVLPYLIGKLF